MGKSMEELESMPTADSIKMKVIEGNIDQIGDQMKSMNLGERNVEVINYPTKSYTQLMHNTMRDYDPEYDESIREKKKQSKMKIIDRMLRCPSHNLFRHTA